MPAEFVVERTPHRRFPFRVTIQQNGAAILAVRAQSSWPGPGQQIFCLRERELDPEEPLEPVERVGIAHLGRVGRKLTLVLDRPIRKRCEFLVVRKQSATGARTSRSSSVPNPGFAPTARGPEWSCSPRRCRT